MPGVYLTKANDQFGLKIDAALALMPSHEQKLTYLQSIIIEIQNSMQKLAESQVQIIQALELEPEDADFKEAVDENKVVLKKMDAQLKYLCERTQRMQASMCDSFQQTSQTSETQQSQPTPQTSTQHPTQRQTDEQGGLYL